MSALTVSCCEPTQVVIANSSSSVLEDVHVTVRGDQKTLRSILPGRQKSAGLEVSADSAMTLKFRDRATESYDLDVYLERCDETLVMITVSGKEIFVQKRRAGAESRINRVERRSR